ncbi:MAG TPA: choice-of-anchor tandem repeat GloVer-containing protein [Candidatus Acidoferrales bacterium]|nr:choice-of-anchor tandem repeat GloVer-containing protein [Candidatus Acidoferrales bacterium]
MLTNCTDGDQPSGRPILAANGKLYGVTYAGGDVSCPFESGCGTVFEVDTGGNETVLHNFTSNGDGAQPAIKLTQDVSGNFYGTTYYGGLGYSTVFKVSSSGQESVLYSFCMQANCADGEYPNGALIRDNAGNLYGIASEGGNPIYKITAEGMESVILYPPGFAGFGYGLVMDAAGNLYGTTFQGGAAHTGSIYKLTKE